VGMQSQRGADVPVVSRFFGIAIAFYWVDHLPPHFHAKYAGDEAMVDIRTGDLVRGGLSPRAASLVDEWRKMHVAELLDTSVPAVNSALQRARATLDGVDFATTEPWLPDDTEQRALLARYVDAFERYDMEALTALVHEDATQSMPPYELWLRGRDDILAWWAGPGMACAGSRLVPTVANGSPAFGQYRTTGPWALQVLEIEDGRIVELSFFLDTATLFPRFGLPTDLD